MKTRDEVRHIKYGGCLGYIVALILSLVFFATCEDKAKEPTIPVPSQEEVATRKKKLDERDKKEKLPKIDCNWGLDSNHFKKQKKRPDEFNIGTEDAPIKARRGKKPQDTTVTQPPLPPTTSGGGTIYLNFYGRTVSNTTWNVYGPIYAGHSGFAQPEIDAITLQVISHYTLWNVTVTTSEAVYNNTPAGKKTEIILTESYQWYGNNAAGVAYVGSYFWATPAPAFVFPILLGYNVHNVGEAAAHEAGHTIGLRHQCDCSGTTITRQYSVGKTMGNSYPTYPIGAWVVGTSSAACAIQDDKALLTAKLGLKQ